MVNGVEGRSSELHFCDHVVSFFDLVCYYFDSIVSASMGFRLEGGRGGSLGFALGV